MRRWPAIILLLSAPMAGCAATTEKVEAIPAPATAAVPSPAPIQAEPAAPADVVAEPRKPGPIKIIGSDGSKLPDKTAAQDRRGASTASPDVAAPTIVIQQVPAPPVGRLSGMSADDELDRMQREILMRKAAKALDRNAGGVVIIDGSTASGESGSAADREIERAQREVLRSKLQNRLDDHSDTYVIVRP
ncbi:hypothetical protein [Azospirillum sp. B506]|uniref:hypothetical protein n=1 Tax=Azospirillum sp. B506 TaxID=137721 RepID=UPI0005B28414|nr:hypothetical protein [Azospirillum sp. B506]